MSTSRTFCSTPVGRRIRINTGISKGTRGKHLRSILCFLLINALVIHALVKKNGAAGFPRGPCHLLRLFTAGAAIVAGFVNNTAAPGLFSRIGQLAVIRTLFPLNDLG